MILHKKCDPSYSLASIRQFEFCKIALTKYLHPFFLLYLKFTTPKYERPEKHDSSSRRPKQRR